MIDDTLTLSGIPNNHGKKEGPVQGYNLPHIASNWSLRSWTVDPHLKRPPVTLNSITGQEHACSMVMMKPPCHFEFQNSQGNLKKYLL